MVGPRTLNPSILVRIQASQLCSENLSYLDLPYLTRLFVCRQAKQVKLHRTHNFIKKI